MAVPISDRKAYAYKDTAGKWQFTFDRGERLVPAVIIGPYATDSDVKHLLGQEVGGWNDFLEGKSKPAAAPDPKPRKKAKD